MSGVSVLWYLLKTNTPVLAVVPAARIMAGQLPLKTELPAISVQQISSVPYNLINTNEPNKMHIDRVQVSVHFKGPQGTPPGAGIPGVKALLKLVLAGCPSQRGLVNSVAVDSISPDLEGPFDTDEETALHTCSRDFLVRWTES